jgi:outer membrane protein assembly factor BamE
MSVLSLWSVRIALAGAAIVVLTGCGSFDGASRRVAGIVTPYKVEVVQGNFVSKEQVAELHPGLGRQQVRDILGTPLVESVFHADRWDYVFTLKRQGVAPQARRLSVFFKDDVLERFEGDEMPSEAEFAATLGGRHKVGKVPVLEASDQQLQKYPAPRKDRDDASSRAAQQQPSPAEPVNYPPLEAPQH